MKTYYECFPCFMKQALRTLKHFTTGDSKHDEMIIRDILHVLGDMDFTMSPPEMTREIFDIVEKYYGKTGDVYFHEKRSSNKYILDMYSELEEFIVKSEDHFDTAMRLAITGNIIDFGANSEFLNEQIHKEIDNALKYQDLDSGLLKGEIDKAKNILYIGDNAGEIVFDKLFIEQLQKEKITYTVRGRHVLNDALMGDAKMVGMTEVVNVISSGSSFPGTVLKDCSKEFVEKFNEADLIIAKGQGNYETLSDVNKNIIFLLRIKCPVVARDIGHKVGGFYAGRKN
ncbi:MAG: ARMT1-like domain-containing protein [Victivallales bacterium]|nr:ARMT1-like domain-containing protein [Victivallales bacterium]